MTHAIKLLGWCLLLLLATIAPARAASDWLPAEGLWWNPAEHGIYYHVSVGPQGFVFVAVTLYDAAGAPTFLVMQAPFEPSTLAQWRDTGVYGRVRSPLYRMQGGQALGGPYRNPTTTPSAFGDAEIEFRNDGRAVFKRGTTQTPLARYPLFVDAGSLPANRLDGRWLMRIRTPAGVEQHRVQIGPRLAGTAPISGPLTAFAAGDRLGVTCLDCAQPPFGAAAVLVQGALGASVDNRIRLHDVRCDAKACATIETAILHERDGVLHGRGVGAVGQADVEFTLYRLGTRETPGAAVLPSLPTQGLWWNGAEHGIYYHVSVGPGGFVFVAITLFDANGAPTFLVMQGPFEALTADDWRRRREIGRLVSPLYRMSGGQCLDCPYRDATTRDSGLGNAELLFYPGGATFSHAGRVTYLAPTPLYPSAAGVPWTRALGRWLVIDARTEELSTVDVVPDDTGFGSPRFPGQTRRFACVSCTPAVAALLTVPGFQLLPIYEGTFPFGRFFIGFGLHFSEVISFQQRGGVLLGRRTDLTTSPDLVLHRLEATPASR